MEYTNIHFFVEENCEYYTSPRNYQVKLSGISTRKPGYPI